MSRLETHPEAAPRWSRRDLLTAAAAAGIFAPWAAAQENVRKGTARSDAEAPVVLPPGGLTDESLGTMLEAFSLKPKRAETRYDFAFASTIDDEEWTLSMSAVLSTDQQTLWLMAWLDELPRSARDVPRSALLKLLAANDKMGKGRFFSYIPQARRFALQQVVENREMTSKKLRGLLVELGQTVALSYPEWGVANWKQPETNENDELSQPAAGGATGGSPSGGGRTAAKPVSTARPPKP
jgi:hypothetical protein